MDKLENRNIVDEMEKSFLEYSMSVIISRALPDLRDGLKPVHRRILYAMNEDGLTPDKMYKKSATTVGNVLGRYHPHGDTSVYDSMVRMAQDFSYRYPLVDGHGNFGSIDGDGAAAYRYTEARLQKLSLELLKDINKDTVDYTMNFDNSRKEPVVLPSRFPNILVNGTMGIAVGMATNIPPQNLGEVIDGCIAYIDNNEITIPELMGHIKGPDFPTGASILGNSGIKKAYETGRGSITIRGIASVEEKANKTSIVITELPYQVNKKSFQERIGQLVRDKIIDGIADLHDESTLKNGIKVVVTLKRDANANVVLNNLYKHTQLQTSYGINLLMLDEGVPTTLNLKEILTKYIDYQKLVIIRRTKYELRKAEDRVHILDAPGLFPYTTLTHTSIIVGLFQQEKPQICLMGATVIGRDLGPRVSSALNSGLTADCTSLEIGPHEDKKKGLTYDQLLYQIRPAFGGNIVATIINPEQRPQMATVREGVMNKEILDPNYKGEIIKHDASKFLCDAEIATMNQQWSL